MWAFSAGHSRYIYSVFKLKKINSTMLNKIYIRQRLLLDYFIKISPFKVPRHTKILLDRSIKSLF